MGASDKDSVDPGGEPQNKHLSGLLKGLMSDLSLLIRMEIALARAEMKEKIVSVGVASALLVVAAFFGLLAVAVMTATIIIAISVALPAWLAALIVTVAYLLVAIVLVLVGVRRLSKSDKPAAEKTIETAKEGTHGKEDVTDTH